MVSFFIFIFMLNGFDPAASESPKEETIVGDYKLELFETGENYEVSKKVCEDRDAWLVEIKDEDIEAAVKSLRSSHSLWIGLKFTNGGWKWSDGTLLKYANWLNAPTSRTTCVEMDFKSGLWSTKGCTSPTRYVCQSDINYPGSSTFSISSTKLTRSKAEEKCESNDSRLVDVKTPGFNSVIKEKLKNFYRGNENSERYYWTSGNDIETERTWKWGDETLIDGSTADWAENEPNTKTGHDCLAIYMGSSQAWVGMTCSAEHKYICYKNVTSGDCLKNVCLNGGTCAVSKRRYSCSCPAGYFGTKCEKELIKVIISTASKVVKKGQDASVTLDIISYDGDATVVVTSNVTFNHNVNVEISKPGTSKIINLSLREQLASAKYTFSVTSQSNPDSYRREVNAEVLVKDHCTSSPCQNGGTCRFITSDPYFNCTCDPAYEGSVCEILIKFVDFENCSYHVKSSAPILFNEANSTCSRLGGTLAMMKSEEIQSTIEKQFIAEYGDTTALTQLWIGGQRIGNTWYWLDGTDMNVQKSKINTMRDFIILGNHGKKSINDMRWFSKTRDESVKGYACEKPVGNPCTKIGCLYGASCVKLGCQANCKCVPGYYGERCQNDLITVAPTKLHHTAKVGQILNITLNILSVDGLVRIDVFNGLRATELRGRNLSDTVIFTVGPFTRRNADERYRFQASPEKAFGSYYKTANVRVTVEEPPLLLITPTTLALPQRRETTVKCTTGGFLEPVVVWKRGGSDVTTSNSSTVYQTKSGPTATLYFTSRARTEVGIYTCFAKNQILGREEARNGTVFIRGKILPVSFSQNTFQSAFELATISCTFESFPESTIHWEWGENEADAKDVRYNDPGNIFNFDSVTEKTSPIFRKRSTLNIKLAEYIDSTRIYCFASNEHEKSSGRAFLLNRNLTIGGNKSYRIYESFNRNFIDAQSYCRARRGKMVEISSNKTHKMLADKLKTLGSATHMFIGAQRRVNGDQMLWKWNSGEVLYNETKYVRLHNSYPEIVDGKFVAWAKGEPRDSVGNCATMTQVNAWLWSTASCSESNGFICESEIAGIPKNFAVSVEPCSAGISISWDVAPQAIGVIHRIHISELDNANIVKIEDETPNKNSSITKRFTNLQHDVSYKVNITVCPDCPRPFSISNQVKTHSVVSTANQALGAANVVRVAATCKISWTMNSSSNGIIGFKISAHSVLAHAESKKYSQIKTTFALNSSSTSRYHVHNTQPNRNYMFEISVITCTGIGSAYKVEGECISKNAAPFLLPSPVASSEANYDGTMKVKINIPEQSNGPLSCVFVVVTYKPNKRYQDLIKYGKEDLMRAMSKSTASSLVPGDSYIALTINRMEMIDAASDVEYVSRMLGDGSQSECEIRGGNIRGKRSAPTEGKIQANNRKLEVESDYNFFTVSSTPGADDVYFQTSNASYFRIPSVSTSLSGGTIAGIVVPIAFAICVVASVIFFLKRKRGAIKTATAQINMQEIPNNEEHVYASIPNDGKGTKSNTVIALENLQDIYKNMLMRDGLKFREEFAKLHEDTNNAKYTTEVASISTLSSKNRSMNIVPSDQSRVVLERGGEHGYINASFVDGFSKDKRFVATQGPLPATIGDFWNMIVEQKCNVIVMLTQSKEGDKDKSEIYWPNLGASRSFDGILVENATEESYGAFAVRTLKLTFDDQNVVIKQFHLLNWPVRGVPVTTTSFKRFHEMVSSTATNGPIVVHCSAGAGRTGMFIAYDILSQEAEFQGCADIYSCVRKLREQRVGMVQTCDQYMLLYKLLLEKHRFGNSDRTAEQAMDVSTSQNLLEEEFNTINVVAPFYQNKCGQETNNRQFNRRKDIVPYKRGAVLITQRNNESQAPYVNASFIESYSDSAKLIAAQGPLPNTIEYFWRVVLDHNVNTIVMLTKCSENKKEQQCAQYWPENATEKKTVNDISISIRSVSSTGQIVLRELEVTREEEERVVKQYQYSQWSTAQCPTNASDVLDLIEKMHSSGRKDENAAVLIHCSDGAGRTGTFCAILNLIERLEFEKKVDVFRAVKDLRDCRPGMVQTLEQYRFCYEVVSSYLRTFKDYSNFDFGKEKMKNEGIYDN